MRIVAYERVSTAQQGSSGLGLKAQRQAIEAVRSATLIGRFTEKESGRNANRPELAKALHHAKVTGSILVIANSDRFAADLAPVVADIRAAGHRPLRAIAAEINDRGMMTRRGGRWNAQGVSK